jgi:hypothetical protein
MTNLKRLFVGPKVYATAYLVAIPIFAFVYWYFLPTSFYAPYTKFEEAARLDQKNAGQLIDRAMHRTLLPGDIIISKEKLVSFGVVDATADEFQINFIIEAKFELIQNDARVGTRTLWSRFHTPAEIPWVRPWDKKPTSDSDVFRPVYWHRPVRSVYPDHGDWDKFEAEFVDRIFPVKTPTFEQGILVLLPNENEALESLFAGMKGDPTRIGESFWRMAYFSAIVITTIGFGDIVPITPVARLIVAFEGILGIILAGLFLNALMQRPAK